MAHALLVIPSAQTRLVIQRLLENLPNPVRVTAVKTLADAKECISNTLEYDLFLFSSEIEDKDIATFIEFTKKRLNALEAAFVMLLKPDEQTKENISSCMVFGIHGFLCEPISQEGLEEIIQLARNVRGQGSGARLKAASGLLLSDIREQNEEKKRTSPSDIWDEVKESFDWYKKVTGQSVTVSVVEDLRKASPTERINEYNGASKRVRNLVKCTKLEEKLKEKLSDLKDSFQKKEEKV